MQDIENVTLVLDIPDNMSVKFNDTIYTDELYINVGALKSITSPSYSKMFILEIKPQIAGVYNITGHLIYDYNKEDKDFQIRIHAFANDYIDLEIENFTYPTIVEANSTTVAMVKILNYGKKGIISIETKYTDLLGKNSSTKREKKDILEKKEDLFDVPAVFSKGYSQLARNFLLTFAYKKLHHLKYMEHVILSPRADKHSVKEIDTFKGNLNKYSENITKMDLEDFIKSARKCSSQEYVDLIELFYQRYLDFRLIENFDIH